jgi:hypothetical protein
MNNYDYNDDDDDDDDDNIHFFLDDNNDIDNDHTLNETDINHIEKLMNDFEQVEFEPPNDEIVNYDADDYTMALINNYNENYNVKDLIKICDYYGITKNMQKPKKIDIIYLILFFENAGENIQIVLKRKQLWHYINELKSDKMMKKYVLW